MVSSLEVPSTCPRRPITRSSPGHQHLEVQSLATTSSSPSIISADAFLSCWPYHSHSVLCRGLRQGFAPQFCVGHCVRTNMDPITCASFLQCFWEPVQQAVQGFFGTAVTDYLNDLRGRAVAAFKFEKIVTVPISGSVVGREELISEIQEHLRNDAVGIIGIHGMGGVGKTTILKKINNDLIAASKHDFDVVIFVTVSKNADVSKIQEEIGLRLGLPLPTGEVARMNGLHEALGKKKFLLLLDDVWMKLDLQNIGIPDPRSTPKKAKVVFATRSKEVCSFMDAEKRVEVGVFNEVVSWNLFYSKLQPEVPILRDHVIGRLAKAVAKKCGRLPLALITVGQAMSNATTEYEWQAAATRLPDVIEGMEEHESHVLSIMKFSYDSLRDDVTRECLLYCALFPEDYSIKIDQLVEYWIGEGFLDDGSPDSGRVSTAWGKGYNVVGYLKNACLLEEGDIKDKHVKMHDIVREMALWLTGNRADKAKRFIVCEGEGLRGFSDITDEWESAKRISLMRQEVVELPSPESECSNLLTLLVAAKPLGSWQETVVVPASLCELMPVLRVLDLSRTNLREIPREIGLLLELRYLNLSWTKIRQLPEELGKLLKLRHLGLWGTGELQHIPRMAIVTLTRLQRLFLYRSGYSVSFGNDDSDGVNWTDLARCLRRLEQFSVDIKNTPSLKLLATSGKLSRCIKGLRLFRISDLSSSLLSTALGQLVNMEWLSIEECHQLEVLEIAGGLNQLQSLKYLGLARVYRLRTVTVVGEPTADGKLAFPRIDHLEIDGCDELKDVGWLRQLPFLEKLMLWLCGGLEVLLPPEVVDGSSTSLLPNKLKYMSLFNLPVLKNISVESLIFPSLEVLWVSGCPSLRRLPFEAPSSCEKIREIVGSNEWWETLEWEDGGDTIGPTSNHPASLCSTLREVFHPISSSSSDGEIKDACRRRFLA